MTDPAAPLTALLVRWGEGDAEALNALMPLVYDNLRGIAARQLSRERAGLTLCATEVVHEAYRKMLGTSVSWQDRSHFLAIAARQMRQVLVDHARTKGRNKRGGSDQQRVTLSELPDEIDAREVDILSIQQALERLEQLDGQKARLVDLFVFAGLKGKEVAEVLGVSEPAVWREWRLTRAWLNKELKSIAGACE